MCGLSLISPHDLCPPISALLLRQNKANPNTTHPIAASTQIIRKLKEIASAKSQD